MARLLDRNLNLIEKLSCSLAAGALVLLGGIRPASAHISIDEGGTHKGRSSDSGLKDAPCGTTGSKRGTNVYTYKPGATINITIAETIPHPGYFRISFDSDGDDDFIIPASTDGAQGNCAGDPKCGPGMSDFCSNETVLLDNLDQHAAGGFGQTKTYTWSVKLPDIECDNCTLQIIQVMNDFNYHPQPYPADDIYYQCIDLVLSNSAPEVTTTPVMNKGMTCASTATPAAGAGGSSGAAGAATAGAGGAGTAGTGGAGGSAAGGAGAAGAATAGTGDTATAGRGVAGSQASAAGSQSVAGSPGAAGATPSTGAAGTTGAMMQGQTAAGSLAPSPEAESDGGSCAAAGPHGESPRTGLVLSLSILMLVGLRARRRRSVSR